jgi:hypothetical protein
MKIVKILALEDISELFQQGRKKLIKHQTGTFSLKINHMENKLPVTCDNLLKQGIFLINCVERNSCTICLLPISHNRFSATFFYGQSCLHPFSSTTEATSNVLCMLWVQ